MRYRGHALLAVLVLTAALAACSSTPTGPSTSSAPAVQAPRAPALDEVPPDTTNRGGGLGSGAGT